MTEPEDAAARANQRNVPNQLKEMKVYGRHFVTKPPAIFYSQEKKMIVNILSLGISIQSVPNASQPLEIIKYRDIISVHLSGEKDNEIIIIYNNRKVPAGKSPQCQHNFRSEDRISLISDYYQGLDSFCLQNNIKQSSNGVQIGFGTISAQLILDKATKSYYECKLTCLNSHIRIEFIKPTFLAPNKFVALVNSMYYSSMKQLKSNKEHINHEQEIASQLIHQAPTIYQDGTTKAVDFKNIINFDCATTKHANEFQQQQQTLSNNDKSNTPMNNNDAQAADKHAPQSQDNDDSQKRVLVICYKDIYRIQKKSNGFQINLLKPSLSYAFFNNDLNVVNQFINKVQKNWKDSARSDVSVTSTLQEEIHNPIKFNEKDMEVDFAILARRVLPSRCHKRLCILAIGKSGIFEVDRVEMDVYEQFDIKYMKDIIREQSYGGVRNSLKLVFMNGVEVEYVFEPYQRDLFIVELLTNINMYYDIQSPSRRVMDLIHSRTPNYALEIRGWKMENGSTDRDIDVDAELMKNILTAKGEEAFFSALREFNVNCNLKKTIDADLNLYKYILGVVHKHLAYFEEHDLLYFIKHLKVIKTIPVSTHQQIIGCRQKDGQKVDEKQDYKNQQQQQIEGESILNGDFSSAVVAAVGKGNANKESGQTVVYNNNQGKYINDNGILDSNSSILYQNRHEDHNWQMYSLQRDAAKRFIDEEYHSSSFQQSEVKRQENNHQHDETDPYEDETFEDLDEVFECAFSPVQKRPLRKHSNMTPISAGIQQSAGKSAKQNPFSVVSPFTLHEDQKQIKQPTNQQQNAQTENKFNDNANNSKMLGGIQSQQQQSTQPSHRCPKDPRKLFQLCAKQEYSWQEEELMTQMRLKSLRMLKKLPKRALKHPTDPSWELRLEPDSIESHLVKVEEMLKCLTIFQNCKKFFEDKTMKIEKSKEFRCILQLLSNPEPLIVYQTSQFFKRVGYYHNNLMQKAETENKNFLLDNMFNILDRVFYQISNYTLIQRPLTRSTFMLRIYSCLSIINTLFQARIESTSSIHRTTIINHLQTPLFFAVVNRILRYNSFSLVVNCINLLNALYFFSTNNKPFINMILQNSTILLFLLHLVIQEIHSSKQLKEIAFNLLFSLLYQRSQACFIMMSVFPKQLFKMLKTESLFVDQWQKQEWYAFLFQKIQEDIKTPYYFWLKNNLKQLDEALLEEDGQFLEQQTLSLFRRIQHASDLQQFYPNLFSNKDGSSDQSFLKSFTASGLNASVISIPQSSASNNTTTATLTASTQKKTVVESDDVIAAREAQKDVFAKIFWNIDDFSVEYENVKEQQLCGRYYLKQLLGEGRRLLFDFVDAKNQIMEKEIKELWENLVSSLMNNQCDSSARQQVILRMMTVLYKEYSKVIKQSNILPYLIHISNVREFIDMQYVIVQLILTMLTSEDSVAKQIHCAALVDNDGIQQLLRIIFSRTSPIGDNSILVSGTGVDASPMKLREARTRQEENLCVIHMCIRVIGGCISLHSQIYKKRQVFPETKAQKICFMNRNWRLLMNVLLLQEQQGNQQQQQSQQQAASVQQEAIVRYEYLKLTNDYLMNDRMLYIDGFVEFLLSSISEYTAKLSFTIMKALFYRLLEPYRILDEIVNGIGLTSEHIQLYPFFKYLPVQFLLLLLVDDAKIFAQPYELLFQLQLQLQKGINTEQGGTRNIINITEVDLICGNYKSDKQERYDLIWNKSMRNQLKEAVSKRIDYHRQRVSQFYNENLKPSLDSCPWTDFTLLSQKLYQLAPIFSNNDSQQQQENLQFEVLQYPELQHCLTACQIYLKEWSLYPDIDYSYLPHTFAEKTISLIKQYSFRPNVFTDRDSNTDSNNSNNNSIPMFLNYELNNLFYLFKAQIKIYKLKVPQTIPYPYQHVLAILQLANQIFDQTHKETQEIGEEIISEMQENLKIKNHNNGQATPEHKSRKQGQRKVNRSKSSVEMQSQNEIQHQEDSSDEQRHSEIIEKDEESDEDLEEDRHTYLTLKTQLSEPHSPEGTPRESNQRSYDISTQQLQNQQIQHAPYVLQLTKEQKQNLHPVIAIYLKKMAKLIFLSFQETQNLESFISKEAGFASIMSVIRRVLKYSEKTISAKSVNSKNYFENIRIEYHEVKSVEYCVMILERIYKFSKIRLNHLSVDDKNEMCLLIQRAQKISIVFYHYFLEKQGGIIVSGNNNTNSNATTNAAVPVSSNELLDRVFMIDKSNILSSSDTEVEKHFKAACRLNTRIAEFTLQLASNAYFLMPAVKSGCVWRALELILAQGKPFNISAKKNLIENIHYVAVLSAQTIAAIMKNCEFIKKFENLIQPISISLKRCVDDRNPESLRNTVSEIEKVESSNNNKASVYSMSEKISLQDGEGDKKDGNKNEMIEGNLHRAQTIALGAMNMNQTISEEEQSRSDEQSSVSGTKRNHGQIAYSPQEFSKGIRVEKGRSESQTLIQEQEEFDATESTPAKSNHSEEEKKELQFLNMQLLRELGPLGRDRLQFFVNQFLTALTKNVDEHLLRYLREERYDQFTRKINSNIELPDFIWNQLSRDNLDLNLKQQIIKVNSTQGKIYIDKLLEHQGIIKVDEKNQSEDNDPSTSINNPNNTNNLNANNMNVNTRDSQAVSDGSEQQQHQQQQIIQEVKISGVLLRVFNEADNFELTNPQTFQQEIFNQLKKYIDEIEHILQEQETDSIHNVSDPQSINQPFETQAKAVKECIKATYSLLTRYQGQQVILNPANISTFFRLLQMELDHKMSLSAFKISIAKILSELSGSLQGAKTLLASNTYVIYVVTNLLECSTMATPIVQQFLNSVQKLARIHENLEPLVKKRVAGVLLLNTLKKEFFKSVLRVQMVEVLNEIFSLNPTFSEFTKKLLPVRIYQRLFSEGPARQSTEVIEILENVSITSDLLWTNSMRLELIMMLEQDIKSFLKDSNEDREWIAPLYPEMQNEIVCAQIFLRIFNLTPASTKLSDLNQLVPLVCGKQQVNEELSFSDVLLDHLIQLAEQFQAKFIELQDENIAKRKKEVSGVQAELADKNNKLVPEVGISKNELPQEQQNSKSIETSHESQDPSLQEFDRVSTSYITCLTSLMLCIEHIIIQEKRSISELPLNQICKQFKILSENRSHSHIKSTVIQIAYLLKDQANIQLAFIESQFYKHVSQALSYSLDNRDEQDYLTGIEQVIILNLLIMLVRDKTATEREKTIEENKSHCVPVICRLLESITEENSFIKSYLISYCAEVLKSGFYQEEVARIIDMTTFSSKQLIASKNTHCEWVNLWRACVLNYGESNSLGEMQQRQDHEVLYDAFFSLPIQSEFSIQPLPFPPQRKITIKDHYYHFLTYRLQEIEEFKIAYDSDNKFKKSGQSSIIIDQAN